MRRSLFLLCTLAAACADEPIETLKLPPIPPDDARQPPERPLTLSDGSPKASRSRRAPPQPTLYRADRARSPITHEVVQHLRAVLAKGEHKLNAVAKIGDSITKSHGYLHCFAAPGVGLDGRDELGRTIEWFAGSWGRESVAAERGWLSSDPLAGTPSPIDRELAATDAAFATVMLGTNDLPRGTPEATATNLLAIVDRLLARGVVPILSTIPPREDKPGYDAKVARTNALVRAIAQARKVPLVDLHRELAALPDHGLAVDHLHLARHGNGCDFTAAGQRHGINRRNLLVLEVLDELRHTLVDGADAPDGNGPALGGSGVEDAPYAIDGLPFGDGRAVTDGRVYYRLWTDVPEPADVLAVGNVTIRRAGRDVIVEGTGEYLLALTSPSRSSRPPRTDGTRP